MFKRAVTGKLIINFRSKCNENILVFFISLLIHVRFKSSWTVNNFTSSVEANFASLKVGMITDKHYRTNASKSEEKESTIGKNV